MKPLEPPDSHYARAAEGWLELGNATEAAAELERVRITERFHPTVLGVRWRLCAHKLNWLEAYRIGELMVKLAPDDPGHWIQRSYAIRRAPGGGLQDALDLLLPAAERFPKEPIVPFNLACYACQLGRLNDARRWLKQAGKIGGRPRLRALALQEADLEPLWPELSGPETETA